jgi:hypothetical protein
MEMRPANVAVTIGDKCAQQRLDRIDVFHPRAKAEIPDCFDD